MVLREWKLQNLKDVLDLKPIFQRFQFSFPPAPVQDMDGNCCPRTFRKKSCFSEEAITKHQIRLEYCCCIIGCFKRILSSNICLNQSNTAELSGSCSWGLTFAFISSSRKGDDHYHQENPLCESIEPLFPITVPSSHALCAPQPTQINTANNKDKYEYL